MAGKGYFENVSNVGTKSAADPRTWILSPKYNDPFAGDTDRKMAKMLIGSDLLKAIQESSGGKDTTSSTINISGDRILNKLSNQNRGYFDFFLQGTDETFDEKFQVVETLGDSYVVFGLGKKPRVFSYSGSLMNSQENEWRINFVKMFEQYVSISRLARFSSGKSGTRNNQVSLIYDGFTARGAILNLRTQLRSENELITTFAFSMLVTKLSFTSNFLNVSSSGVIDETASPTSSVIQFAENKNTEEKSPATIEDSVIPGDLLGPRAIAYRKET